MSDYAKFAPQGSRGVGYSRTQRYQGADNDFFLAENERRRCYAMIETAGAFREAAAIAALPCVDGLFVGPADLSMARGRGAFSPSEADLADLEHLAGVAMQAGKLWAVPAANAKLRAVALKCGPSFVTLGDDLTALAVGFASLRARHDAVED